MLKTTMARSKWVALCVDIWSSRRMHGYLGITVHFVDDCGKMRNYLLGCPRLTGSHNADAILGLTVEVIEEYQIRKKICYVGSDNGANIVAAFREWMPVFMEKQSNQPSLDEGRHI